MKALRTILLALLACACSRKPGAGAAGTEAAPTGAGVDPRDQVQLAHEIQMVEKSDPEAQEARYADVRRDWLGKRYRWTVSLFPPLCQSLDSCYVVPFQGAHVDEHSVQGWLPRLQLDAAGFSALAACRGKTACQVSFEGELSQLVLSPDSLTSLAFSNVTIRSAVPR